MTDPAQRSLGALLDAALHDPDLDARAAHRDALARAAGLPAEALARLPEGASAHPAALLLRLIEGPGREAAFAALRGLDRALVPALTRALRRAPRWSHRKAAAWALAQLGAADALQLALSPPPVRADAAHLDGALDAAPDRSSSALADAADLNDASDEAAPDEAALDEAAPDEAARAAAARGLGQCAFIPAPALAALLGALDDPAWRVRQSAVITLDRALQSDRLQAEDPAHEAALLAGLADTLRRDPRPEVRRDAARALGRRDDPAGIEALCRAAVDDPDLDARSAALRALKAIGASDRAISLISNRISPSPRLADGADGATAASDEGLQASREAMERLSTSRRSRAPIALAILTDPDAAAVAALRDPSAATRAAEALSRRPLSLPALEGLWALITEPFNPPCALAAIHALSGDARPLALAAARAALRSPDPDVQLAAIASLARTLDLDALDAAFDDLLSRAPSWKVRRDVIERLDPDRPAGWRSLVAGLLDPVWRVRLAAARRLERLDDPERLSAAQETLSQIARDSDKLQPSLDFLVFQGIDEAARRAWLAALPPGSAPEAAGGDLAPQQTWWDDDPAVARQRLAALDPAQAAEALASLPPLLDHMDEGLSQAATGWLIRLGDAEALARCVRAFGDPRRPRGRIAFLLHGIGAARRLEVARLILSAADAEGGWPERWARATLAARPEDAPKDERPLIGQQGKGRELVPEAIRALMDPWLGEALNPERAQRLERARALQASPVALPEQARALQALQEDPDPGVRLAALTRARAKEIASGLARETSWAVLEATGRLLRRPLAPAPPFAFEAAEAAAEDLPEAPERQGEVALRRLGRTGIALPPMGITGHYGLSEAGYERALDAGCGFFFWEPTYHAMSRFFRGLSPSIRHDLTLMTGTMGTTAAELRADVERALKKLRLERLPIFLLFWARSSARINAEARGALDDLAREGLIGACGFSTHQRALALEGIRAGWEVLMIRHNAAHRGIEAEVLPEALRHDVGVITFSNLCYGRLLARPTPSSPPPPQAADCYRYSLSQPGVAACLSAPSTIADLDHNLDVLRAPELSEPELARLRAFGDEVHLHHRLFARAILQR